MAVEAFTAASSIGSVTMVMRLVVVMRMMQAVARTDRGVEHDANSPRAIDELLGHAAPVGRVGA
eukprot:1359165-Rhodomonas_salina.2